LIVDNYLGAFSGFQVPGSLKYKILTSSFKTGQLIIGTWHGTSLKKIATDEPCNEGKNLMFFTNTNYLICESMHMKNILHRITFGKIPILMTGYPRNDILFLDNTNIKKQLRKKLKLPENKKIILYAPTFRADNIMMSGLFQVTQMNMTKLFEKCREQFGGEWIFVFRVHDSVILSMKGHDVCNEKVLSGNIGDDMAEYLAIADILITDYSSSMFDFCLTKRPCFLYCPDLEHYMNVERGFYLNKSDLPFSVAVTSEELYENIDIFSYKEYASKLKAFQKMIGSVDDGHATEKVVEIIVKELGTENVHG
jgi:CDP-glycerol glycerophosphotransferase